MWAGAGDARNFFRHSLSSSSSSLNRVFSSSTAERVRTWRRFRSSSLSIIRKGFGTVGLEVGLAQSTIPNRDIPDWDIPNRDIPDRDIPNWDIPDRDIPNWDIPDWDIPDWDIPNWDIPDWDIPDWDVPDQDIAGLGFTYPALWWLP